MGAMARTACLCDAGFRAAHFTELDGAAGVDTFVQGTSVYAIIASADDDGVQVVDLSDPASPVPIGLARDGMRGFGALDRAFGVSTFLAGGQWYAIVAARDDNAVQIIDIRYPSSPVALATATDATSQTLDTCTLSPSADFGVTPGTCNPTGATVTCAYVIGTYSDADNDGTFDTMDTADTCTSSTSSFMELAGPTGVDTFTMGRSVYAIVASKDDDGVQIIDITNPASPVAKGFATDGMDGFDVLDGASDVATFEVGGTWYAIVVSYDDDGVQLIDLSDPASPVAVGSATDGSNGFEALDGANGVAVFTNGASVLACVTSWFDDAVQIIDVTNPSSPEPVATATDAIATPANTALCTLSPSADFGVTPGTCNPTGATVTCAYVIGTYSDADNDGTFDTMDTADTCTSSTSSFMELAGPTGVDTFTMGRSVYAIVASKDDDGVQIIDITNPASPVAKGFATDGMDGFDVLDGASDVATFEVGGTWYAIVVSYDDDGVQLIDLSDPASPVAVGSATGGLTGPHECTACPVDSYKTAPGLGECDECPLNSFTSTWSSLTSSWTPNSGSTSISSCRCIAGYNPTPYTGAGALGPASLLHRFTEDEHGWSTGAAETCGEIGTVLRVTSGTPLERSFDLAAMPSHTMLQVEMDLVVLDAPFGDAGMIEAAVSVDGVNAHRTVGGTLWSKRDRWSCSDILRITPSAPSGIYSIIVPGLSHLHVFCDMVTDGGGWTLVQKTAGQLTATTDNAVNVTWLGAIGNENSGSGSGKLSRDTIRQLCTQQYKIVADSRAAQYCRFDEPESYCDRCDYRGKQCGGTFNASGYDAAPTAGVPVVGVCSNCEHPRQAGAGDGLGFSVTSPDSEAWTQVWCRAEIAANSTANQCAGDAPENVQHITADTVHTADNAMISVEQPQVATDGEEELDMFEVLTEGSQGWASGSLVLEILQCSSLGQILGGYAGAVQAPYIQKTFTISSVHFHASVSLDFIKIDNWAAGDTARVSVEGVEVWSRTFSATEGADEATNAFCSGGGNEVSVSVGPVTVAHTSTTLKVRVEANLASTPDTQAFAIDNVRVVPGSFTSADGAARWSGYAVANVRLSPGFLDGFGTGVNDWSTAHTEMLYIDHAGWPAPIWFLRIPDNFATVDALVVANATECQRECDQQHLLHVRYPTLEFDCTMSTFKNQQREGIAGNQCYLQTVQHPLRPSICGGLGQVLGGYSVLGGGAAVHKTFDLREYPHDEVTVSLDFIKIDAWSSQNATIYIDGRSVWSSGFGVGAGEELCGNPAGQAGESGELKVAVGPFVIPHVAAGLEIRVEMDAQGGTDNECSSFAIDNVRVLPQLRWCAACEAAAYKDSAGNRPCDSCPSNSRALDRRSLAATDCLCDADYTGMIGVATDRCSPLPKSVAFNGGANAPTVSVVWQQLGKRPPNFNERLIIMGNVTSQSAGDLVWTANRSSGVGLPLNGVASTPISPTMLAQSGQLIPLVVSPDTLTQTLDGDGAFVFRLTASIGDLVSYAEVVVAMNAPPSGGWLQSHPLNGTAVTTTFVLSAVGWDDEDLPMSYRMFTVDGKNQAVLAPRSAINSVSTVLGAGLPSDEHRIEFGATITDAFGGSRTATNETVVLPYVPPSDPAAAKGAAGDMLSAASDDPFAVQRLASAFSSSLGKGPSEAATEMRGMLVASLATSISSMSNGSVSWTPDAVSGMLTHACTLLSFAMNLNQWHVCVCRVPWCGVLCLGKRRADEQ